MAKAKVKYVDGFVIVSPKNKVAEYKKMARMGARVWMKCGALDYKECVLEDGRPNMGGMQHALFSKMTKAKPSDTVWFSYIGYKSRKHRDQVNAKVMKIMEKEMEKHKDMKMPFDMKKFAYGGFRVEVSD